MDVEQRTVGWIITKEHAELEGMPSRVGWGQLRAHANETDDSFDRVVGRTIFMDKSLTEHMMPQDVQIRWRSFEDDGFPAYDGIVNVDWLFDEDLANNIDRFNETDVGATYVWYSVDDILAAAERFPQPKWEQFATSQPDVKQILGSDGLWIQIYC